MKRSLVTLLLYALVGLVAFSQEYRVKSLKLDVNDKSAVSEERKDLVGNPCAILKVMVSDRVTKADGNVIGQPVKKANVTWLYVTDGTKRIDLNFEHHLPLTVNLPDYGIKGAIAQKTYVLILEDVGKNQTTVLRDTTTADGAFMMANDYRRGLNGKKIDNTRLFTGMAKLPHSEALKHRQSWEMPISLAEVLQRITIRHSNTISRQ